MRRHRGILAFGAAAVTAVLCLAAMILDVSPAAAQGAGGTLAIVLKVSRDVNQRPNDAATWQPAKKGQLLLPGHQIRTGSDGFCAVMFRDDRTVLKVSASTEVRLDATPAAAGKFTKKLWVGVGGVWAQVARQEGTEFTIETPTSVASVKGTSGYDIVDASGYSTLYGLTGTWDFGNPFGSVQVISGFQAFSNGIDPPVLTQTPPGKVPQWGTTETIPGLETPGGGQGGESHELRIGLEDRDGTRHALVIRHREAQPKRTPQGEGGH